MESGTIELFDLEYIFIGIQLKAGEETLENVLDKALKGRIHEINLLNSCTNELGIEMGEAATEILALEFRKLLAFNAFRALYQIDKNKNDMSRYAVNGEKYYESIYQTSSIVDFVWRLLVSNQKVYNKYCTDLCCGYIDRKDFCYDETTQKNNYFDSFVRKKMINFKVYEPLWNLNRSNQAGYNIDKYVIMIKHSHLKSTIDKIDQIILKKDQPLTLDEVYSSTLETYEEILKSNENKFSDIQIEEITKANDDSIEFSISNKTTQEFRCLYKKLLNFCFPQNLLSVFTQRYCLSDSDGTLLMLEYLRFLAITKAFGIEYYPSLWILEFWRHHISFNTKNYREFVENVFNGDMYFSNFDEKECLNHNKEDREKYNEAYFNCFGFSLSKSIWPDILFEEKSDWFVYLNLFKTFCTKIYCIKNSDSIYKEPKDITINQFLNSENSLYCQQDLITTPEIMQEACTLENYINFSLINKADRNHIEISHNIIREMSSQLREKQIKNNINAQKQSILPIEINQRDFPADPYLVNWRSKYFIECPGQEEIKNSIDEYNDDDVLSSNGLIFTNCNFIQNDKDDYQFVLDFVNYIETPFNCGPKVKSLNLMVTYD